MGHDNERNPTIRPKTHAIIANLYKLEGKAELVHEEIICVLPTGHHPGIGGQIAEAEPTISITPHTLPPLHSAVSQL